jgi:ABC-type dipeptide/oligopeptide/nickel transport system permease subunit
LNIWKEHVKIDQITNVEYGLFSGFFMNKFACRKKMTIDIFLIFGHYILAMILFRIFTKSRKLSHEGILFFEYLERACRN